MIDYDALPEQRQEVIYQMLQQTGRVIGADIARQLGVSEHTIRRDLQAMVRKGMCKKVYGGLSASSNNPQALKRGLCTALKKNQGWPGVVRNLLEPEPVSL